MKEQRLTMLMRRAVYVGFAFVSAVLGPVPVGAQPWIFSDGFELGSTAGWSMNDEEILRDLIAQPAPSSDDVIRVLTVLTNRSGLPVHTALDTFVFATDCGSTDTFVTGDFNGWAQEAMNHSGDLCWFETAIASPLESGYKFYDGANWNPDLFAKRYTYDQFGELSLVQSAGEHLERWMGFGPLYGLAARELEILVPAGGGFDRILFAHDGQNLFDPFAFNGGWQLQDALPSGILVVGIHHVDRMDEYTPTPDDLGNGPVGGNGDNYADLVRFAIRPFVRGRYGDAAVHGLLGSSLGGLISLHTAQRYPDAFQFAASMSGTLGWGSIGPHTETIIERTQTLGHQAITVYLDSGGSGTCFDGDGDGIWDDDPAEADNYCVNLQMKSVLEGVGYALDTDLFYWWEEDALHNEPAWGARVWRPLQVFSGLPIGSPRPPTR